MSGGHHAPSHGHGGGHGGVPFLTEPINPFGLANVESGTTNPLHAVEAVAHREINATFGTVKKAIYDVLNPAWTAVKNAGKTFLPESYREHGIKALPKGVWGVLSNTWTSVSNALAGTFIRGADVAYTEGVTGALHEITRGTVDHIPVAGVTAGNVAKASAAVPGGILRGLARAFQHSFDSLNNWLNKFALKAPPDLHLTTAHAATGGHGGHGGGHH